MPRTRPAAAHCLAGLLVLALLTSCDRAPSGPGSFRRVLWSPAPGSPAWPRAEVLERLEPLDPAVAWRPEAPEVLAEPAADGLPDRLRLSTPPGGPALQLHLDRPLDPGLVSELRLLVEAAGPGELSAVFRRGGEEVGRSRPRPLLVAQGPRPLVLPLPDGLAAEGLLDGLTLVASPATRHLSLVSLELVRRPVAASLPDPAEGARLIDLGGDAGRGVGLSDDVPLVSTFVVPENGVLSVTYGLPASERGRDVRLDVTVGVEGRFTGFDFVVVGGDERSGWRTTDLELDELAGREVTARARVRATDGLPVALALAESHVWSAAATPATVVLITSDTHRADHLGSSPGGVAVSTPVIDALAARGVSFDDCYAVTNVTNPSHAALLTGVHPRDLGVLRNNLPLNRRARTLATAFAEQGFLTRAVVSARHLGPATSGLGAGFDRMDWPGGGERSAEDTVTRALVDLEQAEGRPLFLWVHLFDAHGPYDPPRPFRRQYWDEDREPFDASRPAPDLGGAVLPPDLEGLTDLDWPAAAYKGEVSSLDAQLDDLLGVARVAEGVLAFTADHGESLGQHGIWYGHAGLYPDSLHVPLVLAFPGAPAGRRVDAPVSHLDLAATLLDLAGQPGHDLPGRSLADLARGAAAARPAPRFALSAHGFSAAVREGDLLLLLQLRRQKQPNMARLRERHEVRLFDLSSDPACEWELSGERPAEARRLREHLVAWLQAVDDRGWSGELVQDPEVVEQLRQLGYLSAGEAPARTLWEPDDCPRCQAFEESPR